MRAFRFYVGLCRKSPKCSSGIGLQSHSFASLCSLLGRAIALLLPDCYSVFTATRSQAFFLLRFWEEPSPSCFTRTFLALLLFLPLPATSAKRATARVSSEPNEGPKSMVPSGALRDKLKANAIFPALGRAPLPFFKFLPKPTAIVPQGACNTCQ